MPQGTLLFPLGFFIDHDIRIAGIRDDTPQSPKASADLHEGNPEKEGQLAELRGEMADSDGTMMRRPGLAPLVEERCHPAGETVAAVGVPDLEDFPGDSLPFGSQEEHPVLPFAH